MRYTSVKPLLACSSEIHKLDFGETIVYIHKTWDYINLITDKGRVYTYGAYSPYNPDSEEAEPSAATAVYPTSELTEVIFPEKILKISCGSQHTLALGENGSVYGYGSSYWGQLGRDNPNEKEPCVIDVGETAADICAVGYNSYIITESGKVFCLGTLSRADESGVIQIDLPEPIISAYPTRIFDITFTGKSEAAFMLTPADIYEKTYKIEKIGNKSIQLDGGIIKKADEYHISAELVQRMRGSDVYDTIPQDNLN